MNTTCLIEDLPDRRGPIKRILGIWGGGGFARDGDWERILIIGYLGECDGVVMPRRELLEVQSAVVGRLLIFKTMGAALLGEPRGLIYT